MRPHAKIALMAATLDPVLTRFRAALDAAYGDRLERVVLFGSRARGDYRVDSDYDVAVFIKDYQSFGLESKRLAEIEVDILYDTGGLIGAMPLAEGAYRDRTSFMAEIRRDGIDL